MQLLRVITQSSRLITYTGLLAMLMMGDGVMSYIMPVMIENAVSNQLVMGFILGFSSIVGIACDFLFARWLRGVGFGVIARRALAAAIMFPILILLFGTHTWVFLLAMAVWGVYYELAMFSNYHFVDEAVSLEQQPLVWGFISSVWSLAWFVAPLLAALIFDYYVQGPLLLALGFYLLGFGIFVILQSRLKKTDSKEIPRRAVHGNPLQEMKVWVLLIKKLWPVFIFSLLATLLMSGFWSVGAILAEELGEKTRLGLLFFSAWTAPPLVFGLMAGPVMKRLRKKKTAFLFGMFAGLLLLPLIWTDSIWQIIIFTFLSSIAYSISYPGIDAAIQEYVHKLGPIGNDLIGLQSSVASFAYIFGPIIAGGLATVVGNQAALGVLGGVLACAGLVGLIVVRREIRLPHEALQQLLHDV